MPVYNDFQLLFEAARQHVVETGHSVYCCDDPRERVIGYACSDCPTQDTIWSIGLRSLVSLQNENNALWQTLRNLAGRERLAGVINMRSQGEPPVSYSHNWEEPVETTLTPEEEVSQLEELWGASEAASALEEQSRRNTQAKEEFESRVHSRMPTRFERKDVI